MLKVEISPSKSLNLAVLLIFFCYIANSSLVLAQNKAEIHAATLSFSVEGEFDQVKEDLVMAIESQGAVISYVAHSSDMLNRTAPALGITQPVYHKAEIILFCKAEISHKMLRSDPHSLALCPYPIAIYSLAENPNIVYLSVRKPPTDFKGYGPIHQLLLKIIAETIEF